MKYDLPFYQEKGFIHISNQLLVNQCSSQEYPWWKGYTCNYKRQNVLQLCIFKSSSIIIKSARRSWQKYVCFLSICRPQMVKIITVDSDVLILSIYVYLLNRINNEILCYFFQYHRRISKTSLVRLFHRISKVRFLNVIQGPRGGEEGGWGWVGVNVRFMLSSYADNP